MFQFRNILEDVRALSIRCSVSIPAFKVPLIWPVNCSVLRRSASTTGFCKAQSMSDHDCSHTAQFRIVKEELSYSRYLNVYNRTVEFPAKKPETAKGDVTRRTVDYDIVGSKTVSFHYCAVFPFNSSAKSVTLIKEYAQGANDFMYGVPCGGFSEKHESLEDCVRKELSEEAHLQGGELIRLIPDEHPGILEVKWCRNRFSPYLVLDPKMDSNPQPQDPEEIIEILNVDLPTLQNIIYGGNMMLPSMVTCNLALHYLQEHAFL